MFFTREDINKIYQALLKLGIKDSELPETSDVKNDDTLAIVQDGKNKQINVREFLNQISLWKREDFINVTDKYKKSHITLVEAIQAIPIVQRKEGLVITFLDTENNWRIYQFRGSLLQFNNETLWVDLYDFSPYIIDPILPDEEDITQSAIDEQGNTYLSLKDRTYNPSEFSGKGYKILRKNIIEIEDANFNKVKKNILTQDMINEPNTIYEIRYDFDLNDAEITIPENCVLKFNGGSLNNGTLKGRVLIENKNGNLVNINLKDDFSIKDDEIFIIDNDIWGIFSNGTSSEVTTAGINNAFLFAHKMGYKKVKLLPGTYLVEIRKDLLYNRRFNECILLYSDTEYDFTDVIIKQQAHANQKASLLLLFDCINTSILNGTLIGDRVTHNYTEVGTYEQCYGINIVASKNILIKDTIIYDFPADAIFIAGTSSLDYNGQGQFNPNTGSKQVSISGCDLSHCRRQGISIVNAFDTLVENCNIHDISLKEEMGIKPGAGIDLEPWNETFVAEIVLRTTIKNCTFNNNNKHIIIANIFAHSTFITGCVFESKKPKEKPQYVSDFVHAVLNNANSNSPKFTNTLNNKYPINIYWKYDNTIVSNCVCKYNYLYAVPVVTECTFTGEYCGISSQSINPVDSYTCSIQRCKFNNLVYISGKGIKQFYDCTFDNIVASSNTCYMNNCTVLQASKELSNLFKVTIKQCGISPVGTIDSCDITFSEESISGNTVYANVVYKNCILKFNKKKGIAINLSLKYTLSISNCRLLINTPNKIVETAKEVILNDSIIEVNHNNNTYTQNYFNNENLIAVNNIIINRVATSTAKTFDIGKLIKDNLYIGDKLLEETIPLVKGNTSRRPTLVDVGFEYYDTTLKKKIIWNGTEWTNIDSTDLDTPTDEWTTIE